MTKVLEGKGFSLGFDECCVTVAEADEGYALIEAVEVTIPPGVGVDVGEAPQASISIDAASVIRSYDRYAGVYDSLFGAVLQHGRRKFARVFTGVAGDTVLEIGVGSGLMLPLYPEDVQVLGVDISPRMLEHAHQLVNRRSLRHVELALVDADLTLLPEILFDHVVLPYVYSVTPDPHQLIRKAFAACKPGGSVWILNHFSGGGPWSFLEQACKPFARSIGFRSEFPYQIYVTDQHWHIVAEYKVNLLGLSRLIHVQKPAGV